MVELGCQDTYWVGGNDKEVLDGIIPWDGLILMRQKKRTRSDQTNIASKLRKLERCGCARSKADEKSSIFFF